jgi:Zn-dependent peptidase ImmA (M78 family)
MPTEGIPVTKNIITWARKRAGFSPAEAAAKFPRIEDWETVDGVYPSYPQLERMADEFKVPVAVFFFPAPPDVPPIRESFRTLPDTEFDTIPRRVMLLLRKAKAFQLNLAELFLGKNPAPHRITLDLKFTAQSSVEKLAAQVREYLGLTFEQQTLWPDDEEALKAWRQALIQVGVYVFKDPFRVENYSGFSLYDEGFPIIYVNNSTSKTRQIFTLFHELGHLLFGTSGIDTLDNHFVEGLPDQQQKVEIVCNRFAAEFLLSQKLFEQEVAGLPSSEQTAELLAARFHVSREFIYRRFLDRGEISQDAYAQAAKKWAGQKKPNKSGGNQYWNKLAYLGRDYVAVAFGQYYQNRIDDEQLGAYLDTKPKNIATLEEYFLKGNTA